MYAIADGAIDLQTLIDCVRTDACGAVVSFLGVVRSSADDGRPVDGLTYEAYPQMALAEMEAIGHEVQTRFDPCTIAIVHRTGVLAVGEASVAIAVGAPHRGAAFAACSYAIDELKTRVEVWKQEHYTGGEARWLENARRP